MTERPVLPPGIGDHNTVAQVVCHNPAPCQSSLFFEWGYVQNFGTLCRRNY
jgi:hypothetical protein